MAPQDFKALLDILTKINDNLAKNARLETRVESLEALVLNTLTLVTLLCQKAQVDIKQSQGI